ncbi:MAG: hypothetical protein ACFBSE_18320 [Prochloraceae cyanobacterium]
MVVKTPTVLLFQDFTGATGTPSFQGWTTELIAGNAITDFWSFDNPGGRSPSTFVLGLGGQVFTFSDLTISQRDLNTTSISVLNQEIALLANTQANSLSAANFAFG